MFVLSVQWPEFDILRTDQVTGEYLVDANDNFICLLIERLENEKVLAPDQENVADFVRWLRSRVGHEIFHLSLNEMTISLFYHMQCC